MPCWRTRRPLTHAPDPDTFAAWQLCWLNQTPVGEIQSPDCDLNVSHFQRPEADWHEIIFISLLESCAFRAAVWLQPHPERVAGCAGLQAFGCHLKAVLKCWISFPFAQSRLRNQSGQSRTGFWLSLHTCAPFLSRKPQWL